ncbi:hypothetical protein JAAARDRAFT_190520 [Jaapia argillacea MUCL 33604]|uniref:Uncharacterized protein n=1 Tax=Jaapia argillacea MUCL 33604 TaxID=933084 RepID=A0A067Q6L2_9AGAM|nr:hypothetical protein JAAARDRAFT_190520 [Jaapia argillacea MUCL 33604]
MKSPSRKYVDLILTASSKWGNWDPPRPVQIGDFAEVNVETGDFEPQGNICTYDFKDPALQAIIARYPPVIRKDKNGWEITWRDAKRGEFSHALESLSLDGVIPGLAQATVKGKWEFQRGSGALLVMVRPRTTYLPRELLKPLASAPILKENNISFVDEVISCPAYHLCWSHKGGDSVSLALIGDVPMPIGPVVGCAAADAKWWTEATAGNFRHACDINGSYVYTPLFRLKRKSVRAWPWREGEKPLNEELWVDTKQPWDQLDENGEEIPFEDTVYNPTNL